MCQLCKTKSVYEFTNQRKVCKTCFIHWFEKKFLYTIRRFELINRNEVLGYEKKNDFRNVVLEELLKMFGGKSSLELIQLPSTKKIKKIAIASTIDSEANKIIHELIKGEAKNIGEVSPKESKFIKPLFLFRDKEVLLYAQLKNLKFSKPKKSADDLTKFIDNLEKNHLEIKWAIVRGLLEIKN